MSLAFDLASPIRTCGPTLLCTSSPIPLKKNGKRGCFPNSDLVLILGTANYSRHQENKAEN